MRKAQAIGSLVFLPPTLTKRWLRVVRAAGGSHTVDVLALVLVISWCLGAVSAVSTALPYAIAAALRVLAAICSIPDPPPAARAYLPMSYSVTVGVLSAVVDANITNFHIQTRLLFVAGERRVVRWHKSKCSAYVPHHAPGRHVGSRLLRGTRNSSRNRSLRQRMRSALWFSSHPP